MFLGFLSFGGCATGKRVSQVQHPRPRPTPAEVETPTPETGVALVSYSGDENASSSAPQAQQIKPVEVARFESLSDLEALALASNPALRRLQDEAAAARAKVGYVGALPDPTVGAIGFASPIETAAGSQRANLTVMQTFPWLRRLDAQTQQAGFEAMAASQLYLAERLRVVGDIRATWYRLYVIGKQIETAEENQTFLKRIIDTATGTVAVGKASPNDVRLGTVEYSELEERLLMLKQQLVSTQSELNRLVGRDANAPVMVPSRVDVMLPDWSPQQLRQLVWNNQPAIAAAQIQTQATRWGIEVAQLKRRPDLSLGATWFAIDNNRPPSSVVTVGQDAWSVGAQVSIPLWQKKYDAMEREASWRHAASHASVDEVMQRYDALLVDLWEQARTASDTAKLYRDSIVPDARQTLTVDQQAYADGTVDFDRVMRDFRTVLTLELGYHRAIGQLATALARIEQAAGVDLDVPKSPDKPLSPP